MKVLLFSILFLLVFSSYGKINVRFYVVDIIFNKDSIGIISKEEKTQVLTFFKISNNRSSSIKLEEKDFLKEYNVDLKRFKDHVVVPKEIKTKKFKLDDGKGYFEFVSPSNSLAALKTR